jgi:hypothetical protein
MAIGDSITAGLFARPASDDLAPSTESREADQHFFPGFKGFEEYRGVSFSTGGDADAVTLANVSPPYKVPLNHPPISAWITFPIEHSVLQPGS